MVISEQGPLLAALCYLHYYEKQKQKQTHQVLINFGSVKLQLRMQRQMKGCGLKG